MVGRTGLVIGGLVCLSIASAYAQEVSAGITGRVTDPSNSAIVGAKVTAKDLDRGTDWPTTTNIDGIYVFPRIPVGRYELRVEATGFKTLINPEITLEVNQRARVDVAMEVGAITESVQVTGEAPLLQTDTTQVGAVVGSKTIEDMPLISRNPIALTLLTAGVTTPDPNSFNSGLRSAGGGRPYVNGNREESNNFLLDGVDNNFTSDNLVSYQPNPDALEEVKLITNNASAEFGNFQGGIVNMVIKSGTNDIHGTVYFFNRNEDLASPAPTLAPGSRPQEIRNNQPGFSLGGPIIKNRTFFFLTGEIQLAIAGESILDTSPSAAWVQAATAEMAKYNVAPNPVSLNLLTIFPANSRTGPAAPNNYLAQELNTYNSYNGIVKVDHRFNDKHSLSVRYMGSTGTQVADVGSHFKDFFQAAPMHIHNYSVVENAIFSPRLVNQVTLGVNYFLQTFQDNNIGFNPVALGLNTGVTGGNYIGAPTINITGFDFVGATQPAGRIDTTGHVTDNLSYTRGRHQLKFGGEYRRAILDVSYFNNVRGTLNFDGTRGPWASDSSASSTLKALSDFLAGEPTNAAGATIIRGEPEPTFQINSLAWWFHDNFQVSPQLNVNFGVRWDYDGVLHDEKGVLANFFPGQGFANKQLYPKDFKDYGPRAGFAYSPKFSKRIVIRGGYGIFFDSQSVNSFDSAGSSNGATTGIAYNPGGTNPVFQLNASNVLFQSGVAVFGSAVPTPPFGAFSISQGYRTPYSQNFNLNVQTQITSSTLLQVGYVGTLGRRLAVLEDINQIIPGIGRPFAVQFPTLAAINQLNTAATSSYNSLQTSFRQQFWKGFSANINYTWSHAIDTASTFTTPMNSYNLQLDKGDSTFDTRHILTGFVSYEAPQWAHFAPRLTKGWQFHGLITFTSGSPINITDGKNIDQTGENKDRPNLIGDPFANVPVLTNTRAVQYFNIAAFQASPSGTYGNLGRDAIFGPAFGAVDFSVFKRTPITERIMSELRIETFNLFNRVNWANPNTNLSSGSFGRLTNTRNGVSAPGLGFGEPRNVQLALKLIF